MANVICSDLKSTGSVKCFEPVKKETRKFLGKTEGFKDRDEQSFYKRMLDAYLKGHTQFSFGGRKPKVYYEVLQSN